MMFPAITALLSVFLSLMIIFFIIRIASIRRREKIELLAGKNERLNRFIRMHGNLVETAPIFLIMLGLLEGAGAGSTYIMVMALMFASSRLLHPIGLSGIKGTLIVRTIAMLLTIICYLATAIYLTLVSLSSIG